MYIFLLFMAIANAETKNLITYELRKDYTHTNYVLQSGKVVGIENKQLIPAINYYRRNIVDTLGLGCGIDSNGTSKLMLGIEF